MEYSHIVLGQRQAARLLDVGIRFFLAAALTASQTADHYAPFALGMVAAAGPGLSGAAALTGTAVGAVLFLEFADALPHLAIAVLIFTAAVTFQGVEALTRPKVPAWTALILALTVWGIYAAQSLDPLGKSASCAAAADPKPSSVSSGVSARI